MGTPLVDIGAWAGNRADTPSVGRALVLPGSGYTVDHPVLFWFAAALADT